MQLSGQYTCWSLRCSWSIACRCCFNYIFVLDLIPGFNGLGRWQLRHETRIISLWGFGMAYIRDFTVFFLGPVVWVRHPEKISDYVSLDLFWGVSLDGCKKKCLQSSECRGFNRNDASNRCRLLPLTAFEKPVSSSVLSRTSFSFYYTTVGKLAFCVANFGHVSRFCLHKYTRLICNWKVSI